MSVTAHVLMPEATPRLLLVLPLPPVQTLTSYQPNTRAFGW
jgi:hypothetical protein